MRLIRDARARTVDDRIQTIQAFEQALRVDPESSRYPPAFGRGCDEPEIVPRRPDASEDVARPTAARQHRSDDANGRPRMASWSTCSDNARRAKPITRRPPVGTRMPLPMLRNRSTGTYGSLTFCGTG